MAVNGGKRRDGQGAATQFCVGLSRFRSYLEFELSPEGSQAYVKCGPHEEEEVVRGMMLRMKRRKPASEAGFFCGRGQSSAETVERSAPEGGEKKEEDNSRQLTSHGARPLGARELSNVSGARHWGQTYVRKLETGEEVTVEYVEVSGTAEPSACSGLG